MRTAETRGALERPRQPDPRKSYRNRGLWISRIILIVASILYVTPIY